MHRCALAWMGGLLLAVTCQVAPQPARAAALGGDTSEALRECLTALDTSGADSIDLRSACPRAARGIAAARDGGLLEGIEGDDRSAESLRDLLALSEGFDPGSSESTTGLDFTGLEALLEEVLIDEESAPGWWELFLRWLKSKLPEATDDDYGWLVDWLEGLDVPRWVVDLVFHGSVVAIVVLALFLIANEVRVSGILRRRRPRVEPARAVPGAAGTPVPPRSLDELDGLTPRQRAAATLALVVRHLSERGWVSGRPSLTTGELEREVLSNRRSLATTFHRLVRAVEAVVYGDRVPDREAEQALLAHARALLEA